MTVGLSEGQGLPPKQAETGGAPRPQSRDALGAGRLGVQAGSRVQPWATQLQQLSQPSMTHFIGPIGPGASIIPCAQRRNLRPRAVS